ncbi:o-succinylbenzoate synthase [Mycolicibacterium madagascariense]|uniref:O-succinylbenzoate synthase n=1 Tax=Mycolicibacterium madagascariense TaxID=212765 RepID=A0A7I7XHE1_9MYCO|nr:enolase C-terminal domain-like protein [Mycolicibacterium madagascariense]MCV7011523.1 O-succinylbenzoate synthase [Mycolicibacterium madagascariense]BBZ28626.1 o-succinylbenzoate synthase [Mycolicibacterium madagascariense]
MKALIDFDAAPVFGIPTRDGSGVREGMLLEGPQSWGEFSPPHDADDAVAVRWLTAAMEGGTVGWPDPRRGRIPIAVTVAAVDPVAAHRIVVDSGCRTAAVEVGLRPDTLSADVDRVAAVRDALGPDGRMRCRATELVDSSAARSIAALTRAAGALEFVELDCPTAADVAALRAAVDVPIAGDVRWAQMVDVVVLRSGPLGGVRRALRLAELGERPCVVSSARETSVGAAADLALAGALPELPFACALGTATLTGDVVSPQRALVPVDGYLPVAPMSAAPDPLLLQRYALADERVDWWRRRLRSAYSAA